MFEQKENMLKFDSPKEQSSYIKVIGVGGGGSNAVNNMYKQGIQGVDFIVCNTDMKSLNDSPVPNKVILGQLGAGNIPEVARQAALDHKDEIRDAIANNTQMLFITAGMGGGTGTGAAPVIAEIAKQVELNDPTVKNILVVAIVTVPFTFEGRRRRAQAAAGIEELRKHVDSILVINNDKLRNFGNLDITNSFKMADDVLYTAVKGIAEIITVSAYVNIDFHDVNTVMEHSGTALMGAGTGSGENRAMEAIKAASTSVLLNDNDIRGAKNVLLYFSYSPDHQITMDELGDVTDYITQITGNIDSDVIWGAGADESLNDELKITLIATGFEQKFEKQGPNVIQLGEVKKEEPKPAQPVDEGEMHIISRQNEEPIATEAPAVIATAATAVAATAAPAIEQPVAEPVVNVAPAPEQAPAPKAEGHVYSLNDNPIYDSQSSHIVSEAATNETADNMHYQDGINLINRNAQPIERVTPLEQPQAVVEPAPVVMQQPVSQVEQPVATIEKPATTIEQPVAQQFTPNPDQPIRYYSLEEEPQPEPKAEVISNILEQSRAIQEESAVDVMEAPAPVIEEPIAAPQSFVNENVEVEQPVRPNLFGTTSDEERRTNERFDRIRRLNEMLHNKPDGPEIVERMRTEELTNEEIYRGQHSSQSEASSSTMDRKGNFRSLNNFLFGRPD